MQQINPKYAINFSQYENCIAQFVSSRRFNLRIQANPTLKRFVEHVRYNRRRGDDLSD